MSLTKIVRKAILTATFVGGLLIPTNAFAVKYAKSSGSNVDYVSVTMNLNEDFADEVNCEFKESGVPVTSVTVPTSSSGILTATTSSLPDGVYDYSCVAKDTSTNQSSPPVTGTVGVDVSSPVVSNTFNNHLLGDYIMFKPIASVFVNPETQLGLELSDFVNTAIGLTLNNTDAQSGIKEVVVDWGDATTEVTSGTGTLNHTYTIDGFFDVVITAKDNAGNSNTSTYNAMIAMDPADWKTLMYTELDNYKSGLTFDPFPVGGLINAWTTQVVTSNAGGYASIQNTTTGLLYDNSKNTAFVYAMSNGDMSDCDTGYTTADDGPLENCGEFKGSWYNVLNGLGGNWIVNSLPAPVTAVQGTNRNDTLGTFDLTLPTGIFNCTGNLDTDPYECQMSTWEGVIFGDKSGNIY